MRLLAFCALLGACAHSKGSIDYAAQTWQALDSAFSDYAEREATHIESLAASGREIEAEARTADLEARVAKWQTIADAIVAGLAAAKSDGRLPDNVGIYLDRAQALLRDIGAL